MTNKMKHKRRISTVLWNNRVALGALLFFIIGTSIMIVIGSTAPQNVPANIIVAIKKDMGLSETADTLAQQGVIRSAFLYKVYMVLMRGHGNIKAGEYLFSYPQSVIRVAERTILGAQGLPKLKVTIPEGKNIREIVQASDVITEMRSEFDTKIQLIQPQLTAFGKPLSEVMIMASIVEKEATSTLDRKIVAGVLWNRMSHHAALQVDPPFFYILGKFSPDLTLGDLAMDSPYNLYKHVGLPPTPIGSPGLETILATVTPTITDYWFYLSGPDGRMHYAVTYEGHLENKAKYIK